MTSKRSSWCSCLRGVAAALFTLVLVTSRTARADESSLVLPDLSQVEPSAPMAGAC